ncbi:hypothetical protein [Streptomyces alboniger]|uniref:Amino acid ABC transporter permease n=1 Tax=Streptomyces alboniger TaxID=132473 RepID=A0A5J6HJV3_STRAD|nr:hypothetical protein [Streptomyces alboniger]QEV20599.1 amino acid ABC transporter permease [Streptomyces alboniger]
MAWDEWEQLKADAAERQSTQMQLNQSPADQGGSNGGGNGGAGTLRHTDKPWTRAAQTAKDLRTSMGQAKTDLHAGHVGAAGAAEGLASAKALKAVLTSWEKRLTAVKTECDSLEPKLRQVAVDMGELDAKVGAKGDAIQLPDPRRER